jgi:thiamine biosynthesis protein ThiS
MNSQESELQTTETVNVWLNGQPRQLATGTSVAALLAELGLAASHVAVEVNQELVPRASHISREFVDGDRLEVVTLVGGG